MSGEKKNKNKGFSLIELIIAIAILVILTGLLAPQFMKYIEKSRLAKDLQSVDSVYTAVQGAIADEGAYQDLVKWYKGTTHSHGDIEKGVTLESILTYKGGSGDNIDRFADELDTILGVTEDDIKLASKIASGMGGNIYVSVDGKMQVGVWFGTADKYANDVDLSIELKVGVIPDSVKPNSKKTTS